MSQKADLVSQSEVNEFLKDLFTDGSDNIVSDIEDNEVKKETIELVTGEIVEVELASSKEVKDFLKGLFDKKSN